MLAGALGASQALFAQSRTDGGNTPQGRPFQYIQGQISALRAQIEAVQSQVASIEQRLQQQINDILRRVSTLEGQVGTLQEQVTSLEQAVGLLSARVRGNEETIAALREAVAGLNGQLSLLQRQVAENTDDIVLLDGQITFLRDLIDAHQTRIANLEQQNQGVQQFLANMTTSNCAAGQAVRAVTPTGFLVCTNVGGGGGRLHVVHYSAFFGAAPNVGTFMQVSCPAAGEVLSGGGYARLIGPESETITYVSNVSLGSPIFATLRRDPINVVTTAPDFPGGNIHRLLVHYVANAPGATHAIYVVTASCIRLQ